MAEQNKIIGYKKIFGFVLPDWIDENLINRMVMLAAAGVVMAGVLVLFVNPKADELNTDKVKLAQFRKRYENLKDSKSGLDQIGKDLSEDQQNAVFAAMPLVYSPEEAVNTIRAVARQSNVNVVGYSLPSGVLFDDSSSTKLTGGKGAQGDPVTFKSYVIKVTLYGPTSSILDFNSKLQNSLPFGKVSDLGIEEAATVSGPGSKNNIQLTLELNYYLPELHSFDLSNLKKLSPEDLALARQLSGYTTGSAIQNTNLYSLSSASDSAAQTLGVGQTNSDLFGK